MFRFESSLVKSMSSRDECSAAVSNFYAFLGEMFIDVPSSIIYSPSSGQLNMTSKVIGSYKQIDF